MEVNWVFVYALCLSLIMLLVLRAAERNGKSRIGTVNKLESVTEMTDRQRMWQRFMDLQKSRLPALQKDAIRSRDESALNAVGRKCILASRFLPKPVTTAKQMRLRVSLWGAENVEA